ncbi:MAG: ribosomal-protein-alanine N-acetyltransferase [Deltaproteobacteria bacterium]|nr:MAG: ribosomal-protein-alanine N-acetyltransferase [Deltaproteobacteria bacterium]
MVSIIRIDRKGFERFHKDILEIEKSSFTSPWGAVQFLDELTNPLSHIWALLEEKKIVGYICFWIVSDEIHIMNIAIHPAIRGKGMAKLLLNRLIDMARNKDISQIWLEVRPSNKPAIALYNGLGFKKVMIRKGYYSDTHEDAIVMALKIK